MATLTFAIIPSTGGYSGDTFSFAGVLSDGIVTGVTINVIHNDSGATVATCLTMLGGIWAVTWDADICGGDQVFHAEALTGPPTISANATIEIQCAALLKCNMFVLPWRTPAHIESGEYGAVLCIDPNRLRPVGPKGPIYYLLDGITIRPGLTDKSGIIVANILDNKNEWGRPYDEMLLCDDTIFIRDNDEFWIGIQQGGASPNTRGWTDAGGTWHPEGLDNTWDPATEAGREWIMGGYICKRYYVVGEDKKAMAILEGKCYMDVWNDQPFGTPTTPRNYEEAVDAIQIAADVLSDVNTLQNGNDHGYVGHPSYFPGTLLRLDVNFWDTVVAVVDTTGLTTGSAFIWDDDTPTGETVTITSVDPVHLQVVLAGTGIQNILGYSVAAHAVIVNSSKLTNVQWVKEFKNEAAFTVMRAICEEDAWEWQIVPYPDGATPDARRAVMLYPRTAAGAPQCGQPYIEYHRNIRSLPKIMMGDTTELITDVIMLDSEVNMIPPGISDWIDQGLWPDRDYVNRGYTLLSVPPPPNASTSKYTDASLIMDDDGYPAVCFQKGHVIGENNQFYLFQSLYTDDAGEPMSARMQIDLRKWRRLKFWFRHGSRTDPDLGTEYKIRIHSIGGAGVNLWNSLYEYEFGLGPGSSPQLIANKTDHDTIDDNGWHEIDLLLPEPGADGVITDLHGWTSLDVLGNLDPTAIDFIAFYIRPAETLPGTVWPITYPGAKFVARQTLIGAVAARDQHIHVLHPEYFAGGQFGAAISATGEQVFYNPKPICLLKGSGNEEAVEVDAINGNYPGHTNVRLSRPTVYAYASGNIYLLGGWSIAFSRLHYERNVFLEETASVPANLLNPKRFKIQTATDMEYLSDIEGRTQAEVLAEALAKQNVTVNIDGDPRFRMGYLVWPRLDPAFPARAKIFHNLNMVIDDIEYTVKAVDFKIKLTLGTLTARAGELNTVRALASTGKKVRSMGKGQAPLTRGVR